MGRRRWSRWWWERSRRVPAGHPKSTDSRPQTVPVGASAAADSADRNPRVGPRGKRENAAPVHDGLGAWDVAGCQLGIAGMIGLNDRCVHLAPVPGVKPQPTKLVGV